MSGAALGHPGHAKMQCRLQGGNFGFMAGTESGATGNKPDAASDIAELAYSAALRTLQQQDVTVSNIKSRAGNLLAVTFLGTSFTSAAAHINATNATKPGLALAAASWLLMLAIVYLVLGILHPIEWQFGPSVEGLLAADTTKTIAEVKRRVSETTLCPAIKSNKEQIADLVKGYRRCLKVLLIQLAVLIALTVVR